MSIFALIISTINSYIIKPACIGCALYSIPLTSIMICYNDNGNGIYECILYSVHCTLYTIYSIYYKGFELKLFYLRFNCLPPKPLNNI